MLGACALALVGCAGETSARDPDVGSDLIESDIAEVSGDLPEMLAEVPVEDVWVPPDPLASSVDAPVPYGIGFREDEVACDVLPDGAPRTLRAAIWYPTLESPGDEPTLCYPGSLKREEVITQAEPARKGLWVWSGPRLESGRKLPWAGRQGVY
jgi:hypothetical protein